MLWKQTSFNQNAETNCNKPSRRWLVIKNTPEVWAAPGVDNLRSPGSRFNNWQAILIRWHLHDPANQIGDGIVAYRDDQVYQVTGGISDWKKSFQQAFITLHVRNSSWKLRRENYFWAIFFAWNTLLIRLSSNSVSKFDTSKSSHRITHPAFEKFWVFLTIPKTQKPETHWFCWLLRSFFNRRGDPDWVTLAFQKIQQMTNKTANKIK